MVKFCNVCQKNNNPPKNPGYFFWYKDDKYECPYDHTKLINCNINKEELLIISDISGDPSFIQAMDELKQKDIIEFNLKMSQFKSQVSQTQQQEDNTPKCPTCGSTNIEKIGGLERAGSVYMFGIFSKKINKSFKCCNCKFTW